MTAPYAADAPPADPELLAAAVEIAKEAGRLSLNWFSRAGLAVEVKADGSPVTEADRATEKLVREAILDLAPESSIIGEEYGTTNGSGDLTWHVDPIDGTKAFVRGVPLYATLLAVSDSFGPAIGVVYLPATKEVVWAGRGLGAHNDEGPVRVSTNADLSKSWVSTSDPARWGGEVFARFVDAGVDVRGWGDGYGFMLAATGRMDAMIDLNGGSPWDFAPMPVIFHEAGGRYSTLDGGFGIDQKSVVASNGLIHDQLLELVNGYTAR